MLDSHVVEFCTLFIITTNNNNDEDNDFKSCIAKPKQFCFFVLILFHGLYIILLYVLFL